MDTLMKATDLVSKSRRPDGFSLGSRFKWLSERISALGEKEGFKIIPYRDPSLPIFSKKTEPEQCEIVRQLETYLQICQLTLSNGGNVCDPTAISWAAIKHMGFRPCSDLFSYIRQDDVIEIHDPVGIQIFRNFNFYHYCSYSLEELYSSPWSQLYTRNEEVFRGLMMIATRVYNGEIKSTIATGLPKHIIEELYSPFKYKISAEVKYVSPLFDHHSRPVSTVAIEKGELAGGELSSGEEESRFKKYLEDLNISGLDLN